MGDASAQLMASPQIADLNGGTVGQLDVDADRILAIGIVGGGAG